MSRRIVTLARQVAVTVLCGLAATRAMPAAWAQQPAGPRQNLPAAGGPRPGMAPTAPPKTPQAVQLDLTPEESVALDAVLVKWQADSEKIKTLYSEVERWENDPVFDKHTHTSGEMRYQAPDKGAYHIQFDLSGPKSVKIENGPHWVCDDRTIFEFRHSEKKLIEHRLPPSARGQALSQGPLPFLFGAKAGDLKRRYFLKDTTTEDERAKGQTWLLAFPRFQHDAANFIKAELILTVQTVEKGKLQLLLPYGLKLHLPNGKSDEAYVFKNYKVNDSKWWEKIAGERWSQPSTPSGWTRVLEEPPSESQASPEKPKPRLWDPLGFRSKGEPRK